MELFRGFKWPMACRPADAPGDGAPGRVPLVAASSGVQTVYRALPGLSAQQVRLQADARLSDAWAWPLRAAVLGIL